MLSIMFLQNYPQKKDCELINEMYRLRHDVFIERLGWAIESTNGSEIDRFDELNPYYVRLSGQNGQLDGCWRALPTTGSYMLRDVFPQLLQGESAPCDEHVWEISRFATRKEASQVNRKGFIRNVSLTFIQSLSEFAAEHTVSSYVTVTTLACERLLKAVGVQTRRLGKGKVLKIGVEQTVALWIDPKDIPRVIIS